MSEDFEQLTVDLETRAVLDVIIHDLRAAGLVRATDGATAEADAFALLITHAPLPRRMRRRAGWRDLPTRWRVRRVVRQHRHAIRGLVKPPRDPWLNEDEVVIRLLATY